MSKSGYSLSEKLMALGKHTIQNVSEFKEKLSPPKDVVHKTEMINPVFSLEDKGLSVTNGTLYQQAYEIDAQILEIQQVHCIIDANAAFLLRIYETNAYDQKSLIYEYNQSNAGALRFDDSIYPAVIYINEVIKGNPQMFIELEKSAAGTMIANFKIRGKVSAKLTT
jgi:hypothetical protein